MNPANIPAENPPTHKRGRKRAPLDPKIREIIGNEEVHGAETREIVPTELAEKVRYSYRQYRKPDAPSIDRLLPQLSALREFALGECYQLCAVCGKPVVSDEACQCRACGEPVMGSEMCLTAPVLMTPGGKPWLLYLHPCCSQSPGWWMSKTFQTMWEMEKPFHTTCPPQLNDAMILALVNSPLLEPWDRRELRLKFYPKLWLPDAVKPGLWKEVDEGGVAIPGVYVSSLRLLVFNPFPDGCTGISTDRKVQVYEVGFPETRPTDEFTTLIDPRYWAAQFQVMGLHPSFLKDPVSDCEFQADEFKLDRVMLKRMGGGGRQIGTGQYDGNNADDGTNRSKRPGRRPFAAMMAKPSHPVFRNYVEGEVALRLDFFRELAPNIGIWKDFENARWQVETEEEVFRRASLAADYEVIYRPAPVLAPPDKTTNYRRKRGNLTKEKEKSGIPFLTWDVKGHPAEYALWSEKIPYAAPVPKKDEWYKYKPSRSEFEYFLLERQAFLGREKGQELYVCDPRGNLILVVPADEKVEVRDPRGVDQVAARTIEQIKQFREEWKLMPRGTGQISFSKFPAVYANGAPVLGGVPVEDVGKPPAPIQVSTHAGREHIANTLAFGWRGSGPRFGAAFLERYIRPRWLPDQVEQNWPSEPMVRWIPPPFPEYPPLLVRLTAQSRKAELPHKALTLVLESTLNPDPPEPVAVPAPPKGFRPDFVLPRWRRRRRATSLMVSQNLPEMNLLAERGRRAYEKLGIFESKVWWKTYCRDMADHQADPVTVPPETSVASAPISPERLALYTEYESLGMPRWDSPEGLRQFEIFRELTHV